MSIQDMFTPGPVWEGMDTALGPRLRFLYFHVHTNRLVRMDRIPVELLAKMTGRIPGPGKEQGRRNRK